MVLLLAGCAVRLVPAYDTTLVDGLTVTNERTLQLFAAVSGGPSPEGFPARESIYNELIGSFDALRVQAAARPVPRSAVARFLGGGSDPGLRPEDVERVQNPTSDILGTVVETMARMREADRAGRLSSTVVPGFKNSYEVSIDQALTLEKALAR